MYDVCEYLIDKKNFYTFLIVKTALKYEIQLYLSLGVYSLSATFILNLQDDLPYVA